MFLYHWPKHHENLFGKCLFDFKMYGWDLGEETFIKRLRLVSTQIFWKIESAVTFKH